MCKFVNLFSSHNAVISISYCWKSNITRNVCGVSVVKDALSVSTHFLLRYTFSERHFRQLFLDFHRGNLEIELMSTSVFFFIFFIRNRLLRRASLFIRTWSPSELVFPWLLALVSQVHRINIYFVENSSVSKNRNSSVVEIDMRTKTSLGFFFLAALRKSSVSCSKWSQTEVIVNCC